MAGSFSLSAKIDVFACPNCRETINTSMQQCSFCGVPIDHTAAEIAAAGTSRVSEACSDASFLKIMLGTLIPFGVLIFVPFLGLAGMLGFVFVKYALPVMIIRWWVKFGRISTDDIDFRKARFTAIFVPSAWLLVLLFTHVNVFGLRL